MKKYYIVLFTLICILFSGDELPAQKDASSSAGAGYIDVHMHIVGGTGQRNRASGQGMARGGGMNMRLERQHDYALAASKLISLMDELGIEKAIIMPPPQTEKQKGLVTYEVLMAAAKDYRDRLAFAGGGDNLNPMIMVVKDSEVTPAVKKKFRETALQIINAGASAFGEMAALHFSFSANHSFEQANPDHPLFLLLADIAAEHNIPIDLHMEVVLKDQALPVKLAKRSSNNPSVIKATIPGFERLLNHNPNARIVWQHVGWDNTGHMTTQLVRRLLQEHPNLYCALKYVRKDYETFQLGPGIMDEDMKIRHEWLELIGEFPDRFIIGADEFVKGSGHRTAPPSFADTWAVIDQIPKELRKKVGRENAMRIYRLN